MNAVRSTAALFSAVLTLTATARSQPASPSTTNAAAGISATAASDRDVEKKASDWVAALQLNDAARGARVKEVVLAHLKAVRDWHNEHPFTTVPAGINPVTGKPLSALDRQVIADSAIPKSVHESLMTGLRRDLNGEQAEAILDKYTVGKVAFTLNGYHSIVPDLTKAEEAMILGFLKQAREEAVDYKNMNEISAIFEIYKTKSEQYLNGNGRNWHELYKAYAQAAQAKKAAAAAAATSDAVQRGRSFLVNLVDPELGLLPEYRGAKVYWLYHDNYLAAKALAASHPQVASNLLTAIHREGIDHSGKIELLFGDAAGSLPFRDPELKEVRRVGEKMIRTEVVTSRIAPGWEHYADLLLIAASAEPDQPAARRSWEAAVKMWDGKGFVDAATRDSGHYATYKLALALMAARRFSPPAKLPPGLVEGLLALQDDSGGWITDYDASGKKIGLANVETTSLAILGLEASR